MKKEMKNTGFARKPEEAATLWTGVQAASLAAVSVSRWLRYAIGSYSYRSPYLYALTYSY